MEVSVIGTGALGRSLAVALQKAPFSLVGWFSRDLESAEETALGLGIAANCVTSPKMADVVILCVPDDVIPEVAALYQQAFRPEAVVLHTSGFLSAEVLGFLREQKMAVGSSHPLQTFSRNKISGFKDVFVSVQGDPRACDAGKKLFSQLGSSVVEVSESQKKQLHATAVMMSNYLVALMAAASEIMDNKDLPVLKMMQPLMEQTFQNVLKMPLDQALSGPIKRGDAGTVAQHLSLLHSEPEVTSVYRALGIFALKLSEKNLDATSVQKLRELLNPSNGT